MIRHLRTGIAVALLFTAVIALGSLILNPRFVDDLRLGMLVFLAVPVLLGTLFGLAAGSVIDRIAHIGSSEDPRRAYNLLWGSVAACAAFFSLLAFIPSYLGTFTTSETVRYGGGLLASLGFGWLALRVVSDAAGRFRLVAWPLLLALPVTMIVGGSTGWGRGEGESSRLLVLAFPGLSWNVAEDLIERGEMPNLAELRRSGAWGDFHSRKGMNSPAVWTSVATGKTSDEHGLTGFNEEAGDIRSPRLWDILERRGWSIGVFGWPVTWPPREVDGFIVPAVSDPGSETFPSDLRFIRELANREKTGQSRAWGTYCGFAFLGIRYGARLSTLTEAFGELLLDPLRGRDLDAARLFAKRKLRAKLNCEYFVELRRQSPVDFAAFHSNIVHIAQSYFWKYHEPSSFEGISAEDVERYGDSVHDAYRIVDGFIGRVLADTAPNERVVILSDHGAEALIGPTERFTLRIEPMLREMRLSGAVEATNVAARTYLRMKPGLEGNQDRIKRLFESARLDGSDNPVFAARIDDWGNVEVSVLPAAGAMDGNLLFQGGRCPVRDIIRPLELQESARVLETGAIVLNGKGVRPGQRLPDSDLFDFVPTVLLLTGLDLAADLPGDVIAEAVDPALLRRVPGMVATYDEALPNPVN